MLDFQDVLKCQTTLGPLYTDRRQQETKRDGKKHEQKLKRMKETDRTSSVEKISLFSWDS